MNVIERASASIATPGRLSRRTVLGRFAKWSAAAAATAAGLGEFTGKAYAGNYGCCNLAFPNNICNSDYYAGQCPSGCGTAYEWTCSVGRCVFHCGECYSCSCSYGYFTPCSVGCACSPSLMILAQHINESSGAKSLYIPHRAPGEKCHR